VRPEPARKEDRADRKVLARRPGRDFGDFHAKQHTIRRVEGSSGGRVDPVAGVDRADGRVVVHLTGELDLYNAGQVREALLACAAESPERLVVDLGAVEFIDSTALGVLVEGRSRMDDRSAFVLAAPGAEARRALEVSGLDKHFVVRASVEEALAS
jgi:anti-sigma B factor antagonist